MCGVCAVCVCVCRCMCTFVNLYVRSKKTTSGVLQDLFHPKFLKQGLSPTMSSPFLGLGLPLPTPGFCLFLSFFLNLDSGNQVLLLMAA